MHVETSQCKPIQTMFKIPSVSLSPLVVLIFIVVEYIHKQINGNILSILMVITLTNEVLFELNYDIRKYTAQNHQLFNSSLYYGHFTMESRFASKFYTAYFLEPRICIPMKRDALPKIGPLIYCTYLLYLCLTFWLLCKPHLFLHFLFSCKSHLCLSIYCTIEFSIK